MKRKTRKQRMRLREYSLHEMGLANTKATAQSIRVGPHWTPAQATAVYEMLDDLIDVIWRQHGHDIQRVFKHERSYNARDFRLASIDENDVSF